jgi:hypothetical protein
MASRHDIELEVLTEACEDVHYLWEIIWSLRGSAPELSEGDRKRLAIAALLKLIDEDLISVLHYTPEKHELNPVDKDQAKRIITSPSSWRRRPIKNPTPAFIATDKGQAIWRSGAF